MAELIHEVTDFGQDIGPGFAEFYTFYLASHSLRLNTLLLGNSRVLYTTMFRHGFRIPVHESILGMLNEHRINPAQITPPSWQVI